jgi:hypothetical protein
MGAPGMLVLMRRRGRRRGSAGHEKGVCSATGASGRDLLRVALRRYNGRPGRAWVSGRLLGSSPPLGAGRCR